MFWVAVLAREARFEGRGPFLRVGMTIDAAQLREARFAPRNNPKESLATACSAPSGNKLAKP